MIENLALLKRTKLFYGITENEMGAMLECLSAAKHSYQKGDYVFRRGERIASVAVLLEGRVHIQKVDYLSTHGELHI